MTRTVSTSSGTFVCTSVWTNKAPEQPQEDEYRRLLIIILGSIFGGTLLVIVVAVVVVLLRRYCARRRKRKSSTSSNSGYASAWTTTSRPQVGYSSKRFAKGGRRATDKPRTSVSTVDGNVREQTTSEAFTPEERAKILIMLAGYNPRAFSNAAYDAGPSEFAADSNGHVYDAIPGEDFYDVPLDSAV